MEYKPRLTAPTKDNKYYINGKYNDFVYNYDMFKMGGNCTTYAFGRTAELLDRKPTGMPTSNAENWYTDVKNFSKGKTPKLGAVVCWKKGKIHNGADGAGHVAIVEELFKDGSITISESGKRSFLFRTRKLKPPYTLSGYQLEGFIYLPVEFDNPNNSAYTTFVKEAQKACGANVDGKAGPETLSKTITISKNKNQRHKVVKHLQVYLRSLGYNLGSYGADGCIGNDMVKVIKQYQKDHGCISDGIITAKQLTWKKLLKLA